MIEYHCDPLGACSHHESTCIFSILYSSPFCCFDKHAFFVSTLFPRAQNWKEALHWYDTALNTTDYDEGGEYDGIQDEPRHTLLAREAEMLFTGGFQLEKDPKRSGRMAISLAGWNGQRGSFGLIGSQFIKSFLRLYSAPSTMLIFFF